MKKIVTSVLSILTLFILCACSDTEIPQGNINGFTEDILQSQNTSESESIITPINEETIENNPIPPIDITAPDYQDEHDKQIHTVNHEKDGTSYIVTVESETYESYFNEYTIQLFDTGFNLLQSIDAVISISCNIELIDLNWDGYTDIICGISGGNSWCDGAYLYVWEELSQNFIKVYYKDDKGKLNLESFFRSISVHDCYLLNSFYYPYHSEQKLIWNENILIEAPPAPESYDEYMRNLKELDNAATEKRNEEAEAYKNVNGVLAFKDESEFIFWYEEYIKIYTLMYNEQPEEIEKPAEWYMYYNVTSEIKNKTLNFIKEYYGEEDEEYNMTTYTVHHENDGTKYTLIITDNSGGYYPGETLIFTVRVFDAENNLVQTFFLDDGGIGGRFTFEDLNSDGYTDMAWYRIAGTSAGDGYSLYVWDDSSKNFIEVIDEKGYSVWTHSYEVYDGYLIFHFRWRYNEWQEIKYTWNGNVLVLESEGPITTVH